MTTASTDDIDLGAVWRSLRRAMPKLILLSLVTGGATYALLSQFPPRYTSEAQIQVVAPKGENDRSIDSVASRLDKEAINTHLRSLLSPDLALQIIAQEKLDQNPEFNSALQPPSKLDRIMSAFEIGRRAEESEQDRVLKAFFKRLEVYSPKESRVIAISFTSADPKLAADVANRIAETYRTLLATRALNENDEVQNAMQPKIDKLVKEVAGAEAEVEHFRAQANIFKGGPNNTGLNQQQLGDINSELTKAQGARSEADARAQSVREMVRAGNAEALPDVQRSPLIQNLVQQRVRVERQLSELSATLLPAHPRMRQLRADLEGLQRQIKSEVGKIVEGIEKSASIAASREASVRQSLETAKKQVIGTGDSEVQLRQLEAVAKSKRAELERLQARFEANRMSADSRAVPVEAQIVSMARPTSVPSFPKPLPYAFLVGMAAFLFGIAIVVTKALFTAARTPAADRPAVGRGAVAANTPTAQVFARDASRVHVVTSVSDLAIHLAAHPQDIGGFRALMTGASEPIDAGGEAIDLVKAMADAGADVILIDWSPEGAGIAERMGIDPRAGLNELLQGTATFEDVVTRIPASGAHFIPAGTAVLDRDALLDPDQLNLTLDALDTAYDQIVVVARHDVARALFEAILGRFDAGIIVSEPRRRSFAPDQAGSFLGFEVADIELFRLERSKSNQLARERLARVGGRGGIEARAS
ncbi:lipopolysaccharide biosynthesis protein [Hyphomicrobium sp. xq]|uniref:Lipopolysaccharide biosynthesis protein n=1 Tax=Hyphomicrobium album TaxID=2665159 RepID=A0A6I3KGK6_9HYPH|nr:exopolysaccharide transport family protein [Hyphomicrobium album]MTD93618.1 lipopolysaccharide biosynthesis protein [Hyphomicrobium album]